MTLLNTVKLTVVGTGAAVLIPSFRFIHTVSI